MRLLRLQLNDDFRSLKKGFEIKFHPNSGEALSEFNPFCFAGRNGSGKSNILEALAIIFYHIECIYLDFKPDGFEKETKLNPKGFSSENCIIDAFELEYLIPIPPRSPDIDRTLKKPKIGDDFLAQMLIKKEKRKSPEVHWIDREEYERAGETKLERIDVKEFLPKFVVGYSSGLNEILSLPFLKMRFINFDEYKEKLIKDFGYGEAPEGRLLYVDEQYSQAIILTNFIFLNESVLIPFKQEVGFSGIREFRLITRRHFILDKHSDVLYSLSATDAADEKKTKVELTQNLNEIIDKLKNCATSRYYDESTCSLYLDYYINDATKEAFKFHFGNALSFFQALRTLLTLNYYKVNDTSKKELYVSKSYYVNETIPTPSSDERIARFKEFVIVTDLVKDGMYYKAFSDGEHQFLHTIGVCLLLRDQTALFLFDEPETHLNPDWRSKYITTLQKCLNAEKGNVFLPEALITTHSPFIISDCRRERVVVFTKDPKGNVACNMPNFQTFGASANKITMNLFDKYDTIGGFAQRKLEVFYQRLKTGENVDSLINEAGKELGESVERTIFVNKALDIKEGLQE